MATNSAGAGVSVIYWNIFCVITSRRESKRSRPDCMTALDTVRAVNKGCKNLVFFSFFKPKNLKSPNFIGFRFFLKT